MHAGHRGRQPVSLPRDAVADHARSHLRIAARTNGIPLARVEEVIERVGLTGAARRRIKGYSLGMRQRLGIAGALLGDPPVLVFDEPVNGLDLEGVRWVRSLFRECADEGRTVFVSSHLMSEVQLIADRVVETQAGVHPGQGVIEQPAGTLEDPWAGHQLPRRRPSRGVGEQCSGRWRDHLDLEGLRGDAQVQLALGVIGQQSPSLLDEQTEFGSITR